MAFSAVTAGLFWQNGTEDLAPKTESPAAAEIVEPQPEPHFWQPSLSSQVHILSEIHLQIAVIPFGLLFSMANSLEMEKPRPQVVIEAIVPEAGQGSQGSWWMSGRSSRSRAGVGR